MPLARSVAALFVLGAIVGCLAGGASAQQECSVPAILESLPGTNIFSEQQEVDLGDVMAEQVERNFRVIHDDEQSAFLNQTATRILAQMPPTKLRIRVMLIDLSILNAFSLPGGRIYVARKMVAFLRNDDELAGLLGHEMGHILTHQGGIRMTRLFREVLGVTTVGDRKDILDKFNRLLDNAARNPKAFQPDRSDEEPHQYQADEVALYAVARAGYSTQAFVDFFDRLAQTHGKTGSFFSNVLGHTKPNEKRLREIHKSLDNLPASCRRLAASSPSEEFLKSQAEIVAYSGTGRKDALTGVLKKESLDPPLRTDPSYLKFSPDGQNALAQDDSSIFVLSREPFALQFRIDAPDAHPAQFTPDSQGVVFDTRGMRVEEWNIADQQRTSVHELVVPDGCIQTLLAPDGKTLACFNSKFDISLLDVATGNSLFQRRSFYQPSGPMEEYFRLWVLVLEEVFNVRWVHMAYSPDMRYFIAATSTSRIAVDLTTHSAVPLRGAVADMVGGGFVFVSADRIVAQNRLDQKSSAIVTFPSGAVLRRFQLAGQDLRPTAHGDYVILNHVKDARAGIMDLNTQKIYTGPTKLAALDTYDQHFLAEKSSGEIGIWDLSTGKLEAKASLPRSSLASLRTWAVSPDLKWLAVSANTRGAVWDLSTAKRLYYTRGFRGSYFNNGQVLYADFPKLDTTPRSVTLLDLGGRGFAEGPSISENFATSQYGQYLVVRKPAGKQDALSRNVILEVQDVLDGHSLWTRTFPKEAPRITVNSEANRMVLSWTVSEGAAKDEIKSDSSLETRFATMQGHERAYLLEILEVETGKILGKLLVDTGKGSFRPRGANATGDWVLIPDNENRTLVYSLATGEKKATIFGSMSTISARAGLLAIENESGQLDIYGLPGFEKRTQLNFSSNICLAHFSGTGDRLLVLTSDQTVYTFDSGAWAHSDSTHAKAP